MAIFGPGLEVQESQLASVVGTLEGGKRAAGKRLLSENNISATAG